MSQLSADLGRRLADRDTAAVYELVAARVGAVHAYAVAAAIPEEDQASFVAVVLARAWGAPDVDAALIDAAERECTRRGETDPAWYTLYAEHYDAAIGSDPPAEILAGVLTELPRVDAPAEAVPGPEAEYVEEPAHTATALSNEWLPSGWQGMTDPAAAFAGAALSAPRADAWLPDANTTGGVRGRPRFGRRRYRRGQPRAALIVLGAIATLGVLAIAALAATGVIEVDTSPDEQGRPARPAHGAVSSHSVPAVPPRVITADAGR